MKKHSIGLVVLIVAFASPLAYGDISLDNSISKPYTLDQPNTTYQLTEDIRAEGTAFIIKGENIVFDLNGHTIVYDDFACGIPNSDFEDGNGEIPIDWDLGSAASAKRTSTYHQPMVNSWYLRFDHPQQTQEIVSQWTPLPRNKKVVFYFLRQKPSWL